MVSDIKLTGWRDKCLQHGSWGFEIFRVFLANDQAGSRDWRGRRITRLGLSGQGRSGQ